jgi:hypothetical protein
MSLVGRTVVVVEVEVEVEVAKNTHMTIVRRSFREKYKAYGLLIRINTRSQMPDTLFM